MLFHKLEFYDSLLTYNDAFNIIREICISENLIQSDIYYVIDEPFDTLLKKIEKSEVENYYLGEFDARNKGMNWKYLIELSDMNFNIEESSKIKIKTKFSKESRFAI